MRDTSTQQRNKEYTTFLLDNGDRAQYKKLYEKYEEDLKAWNERHPDARNSLGLMLNPDGDWMPMPPSKVELCQNDGVILIHNRYDYEISLSRIKGWKDIVRWCHHLSGKTWFVGQTIWAFIEAALCANHMELYPKPKNKQTKQTKEQK